MVACWKNIQFLEFCRFAITIRNHGDVTAQPLTVVLSPNVVASAKVFPERGIYSASPAASASKRVYTHWPEAE